jgi:hypothetical protein
VQTAGDCLSEEAENVYRLTRRRGETAARR